MENIFNPVYRQDYFKGYEMGLDPHSQCSVHLCGDAFHKGYHLGRMEYESKNGRIDAGIPMRIVTTKVLEDFLLAGLLGMAINAEGYTAHQMGIIETWYQSGIEKYNPDESIYLLAILEKNGIEIGQWQQG